MTIFREVKQSTLQNSFYDTCPKEMDCLILIIINQLKNAYRIEHKLHYVTFQGHAIN